MTKIPLPSLAKLLHAFFHDWLVEQRNASHRTVLAYRDAWRSLLRFAAKHQQRPVTSLRLEHFTATEILAFLQNLEQENKHVDQHQCEHRRRTSKLTAPSGRSDVVIGGNGTERTRMCSVRFQMAK